MSLCLIDFVMVPGPSPVGGALGCPRGVVVVVISNLEASVVSRPRDGDLAFLTIRWRQRQTSKDGIRLFTSFEKDFVLAQQASFAGAVAQCISGGRAPHGHCAMGSL